MDLGLYDGLHAAGTLFHPAGLTDQQFYRTTVTVEQPSLAPRPR
jgi:hypothetical protein